MNNKRVKNFNNTSMNRIESLFKQKKNNILSIYFTAGFPELTSTNSILRSLSEAGADIIEIGMPFSDPVADGPVIQESNDIALKNGMSVTMLFIQLKELRKGINTPILLMGYINPVIQFGVENFCKCCSETGVDGVILPDLPPEVYKNEYKSIFTKYGICNVLLITPQTEESRIRYIDSLSSGFIYMVSSSAITGVRGGFSELQISYFKRISEMKLSNPTLTGFGISGKESFDKACEYSSGAIIGSAFIKLLKEKGGSDESIKEFIRSIKSS